MKSTPVPNTNEASHSQLVHCIHTTPLLSIYTSVSAVQGTDLTSKTRATEERTAVASSSCRCTLFLLPSSILCAAIDADCCFATAMAALSASARRLANKKIEICSMQRCPTGDVRRIGHLMYGASDLWRNPVLRECEVKFARFQ